MAPSSQPRRPRPSALRRGALLLALLAACTVGPDYRAPDLDPAAAWTQTTRAEAVDLRRWWDRLGDPTLTDLVARASTGNRDLARALERIQEARALYDVTRARRVPDLDGTSAATRSRPAANPPFPAPGLVSTYQVGLQAAWEIDAFGRVSRAIEAAGADFQALVEDYRGVLVSLQAEVARAYVQLRLAQARLAIARSNRELQQRSLQFARDRNEAGLVPGLDVAQAETVLATTEASIPGLENDRDQTLHLLAVLLGEPIAPLADELLEPGPLPAPADDLTAGLPAQLLARRPDLRAAERRLAAATAQVGVETAALYPRLDLAASFGVQGNQLDGLLSLDRRTWSAGPTLVWNLLDGGRVRGAIEAQESRTRQALRSYEQDLLAAVAEVESALSAQRRERLRAAALERAVSASRRSVDLSQELYRAGERTFQNVLDAQRSLLDAEDQLATSRAAVSLALIDLCLALGGSWDPDEDVLTPRTEEAP